MSLSSPDREVVEHALLPNVAYSLRWETRGESDIETVVVTPAEMLVWIRDILGPVRFVGRNGGVAMRLSAGDWMAYILRWRGALQEAGRGYGALGPFEAVLARLPEPVPQVPAPVVPPGECGPVTPHDRCGTIRTFRHPKFRNVLDQTIEIAACKVRGDAAKPPLTVVKVREDTVP